MRRQMRRLIAFPCAGETLAGTLDQAPGTTGILIVSGGNELRIGSHRGMAELSARLVGAGISTLRFDRRGIGESTGENRGYAATADDIAAAAAAFRAEMPGLTRVIAFGNCDAATALALFNRGAGLDALVVSNLWAFEEGGSDLPPPAAIRARYAAKLRDPKALLRLVTGGVNVVKLFRGLRSISAPPSQPVGGIASRIAAGLDAFPGPITLLLARRDNTAVLFREAWVTDSFAALRARVTVHECDSASHSYQHPADKDWLFARLLEVAN